MKKIIILTSAGDTHAYAVAKALELKKSPPVVWHTSDFPSAASESIALSQNGLSLKIRGKGADLENPVLDVVWRRRPAFALPEAELDPADVGFAEQECLSFRRSLSMLLCSGAFWVNSAQAAFQASAKLFQQALAASSGFLVPETLATNDPDEIKAFIAAHEGKVVYKTFSGGAWENETTAWMPFTTAITRETLVEDNLLRLTPGIFQAEVPKAFEVRVTVMGLSIFAAKVLSQATRSGRLDWRKAYDELIFESFELPAEISSLCLQVLNSLGLVFGCFDLIVTPRGEYVFLEVNEMGQFLFIEHATGQPLLDAFSDFLLVGEPDFQWRKGSSAVRFSEVKEWAHAERLRRLKLHVEPRGNSFKENPS